MAKPRTSQSFAAQVSCLVASKRMERLAGIASFVCQRFDPRQQRAWATGNLWKQTRNNPQGEALWLPFQDPFCLASVAAPFRNKWHQMFGGITCKKRNHYLSWRYQLSPLGSPQQQGSAFGPGHDLAFLFGCHQYRHQNPSYFSSLKAEPWPRLHLKAKRCIENNQKRLRSNSEKHAVIELKTEQLYSCNDFS